MKKSYGWCEVQNQQGLKGCYYRGVIDCQLNEGKAPMSIAPMST